MGIEIERKFHLRNDSWRRQIRPGHMYLIRQAYFGRTPEGLAVRVRITGDRDAVITLKGATAGTTRVELEYEISVRDALAMMEQAQRRIAKVRYVVHYDGHLWEIDEFLGGKHDQCIAEVELDSADEEISFPDWIGDEITGCKALYNEDLAGEVF